MPTPRKPDNEPAPESTPGAETEIGEEVPDESGRTTESAETDGDDEDK